MTPRIAALKGQMLAVKPSISPERLLLATEAYKKYAGEPIMLFRAHVFEYVLEHMSVVIRGGELLVGSANRRPRCASIFPEYTGQWLLEDGALDSLPSRSTDPMEVYPEERGQILDCLTWWKGRSLEEICDTFLLPDVQEARSAGVIAVGCRSLPSGKTTPDFARMFRRGLRGYIDMCREKLEAVEWHTVENQPQVDFLSASIIACQAVISLSNRYADEAERLASDCADTIRRAELLELSRICRKVPEHSPDTFREAMQFEWFIYFLLYVDNNCSACGFGRFDVNLGPYYQADIEAERITPDFAKELIQCLFIKATELVQVRPDDYSRDFAGYPLWQVLMLGGVDRNGRDVTNPITLLTLQAASEIKLAQPAVALRVHDGTPPEIWRQACSMIQAGQANPAFFGDKCAIQTVLNKGGTQEEANDWYILGCVEPHQGGGNTDGNPSAGYVNLPKCLELALHNGVDPLTGKQIGPRTGELAQLGDFDLLLQAVKRQICYWYDMIHHAYNQIIAAHSTRLPCIYSSLMIEGCIQKGKPVQHGGAVHTYTGIFCTGAASLTDALLGIREMVYSKHNISLPELVEALNHNFQGKERLRLALLNQPAKFGNDAPAADDLYCKLIDFVADYVQKFGDARGGTYCLCNQAQTVSITMGCKVGATPDGRLAYTPLSDNAGPAMGRDTNGPTAAINSMSRNIHQANVYDGSLINLRFDPSGVTGEKGLQILESLIREYVDNNGLHVQINVVDDATLRAAQADPENHRDIVVRVAGYMAYFTELDKTVQNSIIARTAHLAQ